MKYELEAEDLQRDNNNIEHHVPFGDQILRYGKNRSDALIMAANLRQRCPPSRELSLAITKLEEMVFWANAAIARNEKPEGA